MHGDGGTDGEDLAEIVGVATAHHPNFEHGMHNHV